MNAFELGVSETALITSWLSMSSLSPDPIRMIEEAKRGANRGRIVIVITSPAIFRCWVFHPGQIP
jgi:hypothetical protein